MAKKRLMVDTTVLIDFFRKTDKTNSRLVQHFQNYDHLYISSVTEFEIITGATLAQVQYWDQMLLGFDVLPFDSLIAREAAKIVQHLKKARKSIDTPDLFIAATAIAHGLTLDTSNKKHFFHIEHLDLLSDS